MLVTERRTKFEQVLELLREEILSGEFGPGDRFYSDNNLGKRFGVSHVTASKAISALMHEGLVNRFQGKGTFVAEREAPAENVMIGCLYRAISLPRPDDNYSLNLFRGMEEEISAQAGFLLYRRLGEALSDVSAPVADWQTVARDNWQIKQKIQDKPDIATEAIRTLLSLHPGGVLLDDRTPDAAISEIPTDSGPLVVVDRACSLPHVSSISADNARAMFLALEYLHGLGHRRIVIVYETHDANQVERVEAIRQVCTALGLAPEGVLLRGAHETGFSGTCYQQAAIEGVRAHGATALIGTFDHVARHAVRALMEAGMEVPRDVSVVGIADLDFAAVLEPALTTVRIDPYEVGRGAVSLLLDLMRTRTAKHVRVPVTLVERASCVKPQREAGR